MYSPNSVMEAIDNKEFQKLLIKLKWDRGAEGAIARIHDRKYTGGLSEYKDNLLLVGINYDKEMKEHQCRIEKAQE